MDQIKKIDGDGVEYIKIKGNFYSTAVERLKALRRMYPGQYDLKTKLRFMPEQNGWLSKAVLLIYKADSDKGLIVTNKFTGHAFKKVAEAWGQVACEHAETASVARAIAKAGIGISFGSGASADEVLIHNEIGTFDTFPIDEEVPEANNKGKMIEEELHKIVNRKNKKNYE